MSKAVENASKPRSPRKPPRDYKQRLKEACLKSFATQIQQYPPKDQQELELINQRLSVCTHYRCSETTCRCHTSQKCPSLIDHDTQAAQCQSNCAYVCANYKSCASPRNCKPNFLQSLDDAKLKEYDIYAPERTIVVKELFRSEDQVYVCPVRLKNCRISSGLTFSQIESLSWVTRGWLSRCEKFSPQNPHQKVKIEKSLCYLLAALYDTTPGYLMGHTNSVNTDLFTVKYKYRLKGKDRYKHDNPAIKELSLCVYSFSKERSDGFKSIEKLQKILTEHTNSPEINALNTFLSNGEKIYYKSFPQEIRNELNTFLTGLLHATPNDCLK